MVTPLLKKSGLETVLKITDRCQICNSSQNLLKRGVLISYLNMLCVMWYWNSTVTNDILLLMDSQIATLSAAFDTVDHVLLLDRLKYHFGVTGLASMVWILPVWTKTVCQYWYIPLTLNKSSLNGRCHRDRSSDQLSLLHTLPHWVPLSVMI